VADRGAGVQAFVANLDENTVTVVNGRDNTVAGSVTVGGQRPGLA